VSRQVQQVDTLFLHESQGDYYVVARRDDARLFRARLDLKETSAGPRPGRFRIKDGSSEEPRNPDEFVDIARMADRIRISEQTAPEHRDRLREALDGYQLSAKVVRTCRICASAGRYSPLTSETAIKKDDEHVCPDCAKQELERELSYQGGLTSAAQNRLEELLLEVQDLERITNLLKGELDPDLTKFDTISATTDEVDPVPTDSLDLHPGIQNMLESRFDTLLPV